MIDNDNAYLAIGMCMCVHCVTDDNAIEIRTLSIENIQYKKYFNILWEYSNPEVFCITLKEK